MIFGYEWHDLSIRITNDQALMHVACIAWQSNK